MRAAALACAALLAWPAPAGAQSVPTGPPAVVALGLATDAERLTRLHLQWAQDVLATRARRGFTECVREMDAAARRLLARAPDAETREALLLFLLVLDDTRPFAARSPSREVAQKVLDRGEELRWAAERAARALQSNSTTAALPALHGVARVALLSQRLARDRFVERWEPGGTAAATAAELEREIRGLEGLLATQPEAASELQLADNQLQFLRELPKGRLDARGAQTAAKAADHALESLVRLSRLLQPAAPPR